MKIIIISSEQGRRGIEPGAVLKDIRCYKNGLARVERGSNVDDDSSYTTIKQSQIHNIDIKDKIVSFYQHMYDESLWLVSFIYVKDQKLEPLQRFPNFENWDRVQQL